MGAWIDLDTPHGAVRAWQALPEAAVRGRLVLVQEIFGVNPHVRDVADRFAAEGEAVLAPCLFDPVETGVELAYDDAGVARGRALASALGFDRAVDVVGAAAARFAGDRPVAAVGFCWGGTLAYLANARLGLPAVSYYGGRTVPFLDESPRAPLLLHFGARDPIIPPEDVDAHRRRLPGAELHVYDAGHGFNCDRREDYDPAAAALAWSRTLDFLHRTTA